MKTLTEYQHQQFDALLKHFLSVQRVNNQGQSEPYDLFDRKREEAIPVLREPITKYLAGKTSLKELKETSESQCRQYPFWGFKGLSGQMQLNLYVNGIGSSKKDDMLRQALRVPSDLMEASKKIDEFSAFILPEREVAVSIHSLPWANQSFMLSYFWEMQKPGHLPVFYKSSRNVLLELGFPLDVIESYGEEYREFVEINQTIWNYYRTQHNCAADHPFWFVEHVIWQYFLTKSRETEFSEQTTHKQVLRGQETLAFEFGVTNWISPIVQDLPELAKNKDTAWSKSKKLKPEKAFETKLKHAFTLLGYETTELGQGKGREPDGIALSMGNLDSHYAIVYDAKAREKAFSVGTSDREILDYIQRKRDELYRKRINKLYFVIVSSEFSDAHQLDSLREIQRRTGVSVTCLRAEDLLMIIEEKLKNVDLDHAKLEYLFLETGVITREKISDCLGLR